MEGVTSCVVHLDYVRHSTKVLYLYIRTRIGPGRRQEKSRAALRGVKRQARLDD